MKIMTLNVNGIRSALQKGLGDWLAVQDFDVICLQEIRAAEVAACPNYYHYFFPAEKAGYSGVAIYSRKKPQAIKYGLGFEVADQEGRYIEIIFPHIQIASVYFPSGSSGPHRQANKFIFLEGIESYLKKILNEKKTFVLAGDWNIAHHPIDLKNWKNNQKNSGFLPEERAWLDKILTEWGWVDAFRAINSSADQYTWWSNRGRAYENNVGWRIDYQIVTPDLKNKIQHTSIYKEQRFSDHAPLIMEYDFCF